MNVKYWSRRGILAGSSAIFLMLSTNAASAEPFTGNNNHISNRFLQHAEEKVKAANPDIDLRIVSPPKSDST
ncbi:hypothetical protein M3223_06675 [Paenibacillus pasadenensis]|uniref:hypothetical protein n=1 Tax=Paenibacillus pasadenensis TaxID=217090 RepID=UPI002040AE5A|nr:hypothetical protein [Paenibacillus pasadenensis]MCM3747038.1 hypothetical protein [Paenibacillus pasadenensis]